VTRRITRRPPASFERARFARVLSRSTDGEALSARLVIMAFVLAECVAQGRRSIATRPADPTKK
jgi:hypothetical protein